MSLSHTAAKATRSVTLVLCAGSRVAGSPTMPMRNVSAAPCATEARSRTSAPMVRVSFMGMRGLVRLAPLWPTDRGLLHNNVGTGIERDVWHGRIWEKGHGPVRRGSFRHRRRLG